MTKKCFCPSLMVHTITIQKQTLSVDEIGGRSVSWSDEYTVKASVRHSSSSEYVGQDSLRMRHSIVFTIRHLVGITSNHRILFDGRLFNIDSVIDPTERKRFLEIRAVEGVSVG